MNAWLPRARYCLPWVLFTLAKPQPPALSAFQGLSLDTPLILCHDPTSFQASNPFLVFLPSRLPPPPSP